jgi:hypothetical protein
MKTAEDVLSRSSVVAADRYLTTKEVASIEGYGLTTGAVVDWIVTGLIVPDETDQRGVRKKRIQLPARKIGGRWKVKESDVKAFIDRITVLSGATAESLQPASVTKRKRRAGAEKAEVAALLGG